MNPLRELEEMVVDAWPAVETADLDGWLLRASGGPTHRGNSVAPLDDGASLTLDARIAQAEAWYRERNRPPMFQLGPCAAPDELDDVLAKRGYRKEGDALLALATPKRVASATQTACKTLIESKPGDAWLEIGMRSTRFAGTEQVFLGFLRRLGSRCRFVTAYDAVGRPAASAIGITSEDRLGIYSMFTVPRARRQGAARGLLYALAKSALAERCRELYLLVESENAAARALYAQAGFTDEYAYHYRVAPREIVSA
jgi:ribosomal protein S18 acetylase RimI-like enzyme